MNMEVCVLLLVKMLMKQKLNLFINMNIMIKVNFCSHKKLKFNLEPGS